MISDQNVNVKDPALLAWDDGETLSVESGAVAVGLGQSVGKMLSQFFSPTTFKLRTSQSRAGEIDIR